ncbi:MAG: response regulator transcription factor [Rhodococcus sp. (in: high G+C Gram-positive bacteria)]
MTTVVLADDHAAIRAGLTLLLGRHDDIDIVAEADDGESAVMMCRTHRPDVVLMDVRMPGMDGIEATRRVVESTDCKVLVLTTFDLDEYIFAALDAGASGFVLKTASAGDLVGAVRSVASGDGALAPRATRALIDRFVAAPRRSEPPPGYGDLTQREKDVLHLLGDGLSNAELAAALGVGDPTAKTHVSRVLAKLHLSSRVQAAILARESGL